jgi:hypothetical protein
MGDKEAWMLDHSPFLRTRQDSDTTDTSDTNDTNVTNLIGSLLGSRDSEKADEWCIYY